MVVKIEPSNYWENMLLFWMILNKTSAHLQPLGNDIYTKNSSPTNICLFKVKDRNTKKMWKMLKFSTKDIRTTF